MKTAILFWTSPIWGLLLLVLTVIFGMLAGLWLGSLMILGVIDIFKKGWE